MRWALLTLSGYVLSVPSAFSLRRSRWSIPSHCSPFRGVLADGFRHLWVFALAEGHLPMSWFPSEPLGVSGGSTSIGLHRTWLVSTILPYVMGAQVGVSYFSCATFRTYSWRYFCQFHWIMRVPALTIPLGGVHWTLEESSDWVDLVSPSSLFQDSVDCADFWSWQSDPDASCDRHSVAVALSPSLTVAMTRCNCGALGGLSVLVGSLTSPSQGRMFGPSCCGRLPCWVIGLTYRPPPRTSRTLSHAWLVVTTASSWGIQR